MKRAVQHPGQEEVIDIGLVSERQLETFVPQSAGADAAGRDDVDVCTRRERLDRLDDLHVAGAPAKVRAEVAP